MVSDVEGQRVVFRQRYCRASKNQYPDSAHVSKKRAILKKAKRIVVMDGELYYIQGKLNGFINYLDL